MDALTAFALAATNLVIVAYVAFWVIKAAVKAALKEHTEAQKVASKTATRSKS
jgi:large-conductance mechanosensitive channel